MMPPFRKADKICLICLARFRKTGNNLSGEAGLSSEPGRQSDSDLYTKFLHFTGRYLQLKTTSESIFKDLTEYKNGTGGGGDFQPFCESCRALVTHVCDLYGELQVVKLRLVWKLSQLGGNLKQSKKVVSQKIGKGLLKSVAIQLNFKSVRRLEMFRKALEVNCVKKEKNCTPKTVIRRGLIPECYRYPLPATRTILARLIVVFLLGSASIYMKNAKPDILEIKREPDILNVTRNKRKLRSGGQAVGERGYEENHNCSDDDNDNNFNNANSDSDWSQGAASPASGACSGSEVGLSREEDTENDNVRWTRRSKRKMEGSRVKVEPGTEKEDSDADNEGDGLESELTMTDDDDEENQKVTKRAKRDEVEAVARKVKKPTRKDEHNKPKTVSCSKCSRTFKDLRGLSKHFLMIHRSHLDHTCNLCGLNFRKRQHLRDHTKKVHAISGRSRQTVYKGIPTTCTLCKEEFPSKAAMMTHRKSVHMIMNIPRRQKRFECPICFRLVVNEDQFQIHVLSHEAFSFKTSANPIVTFHCQVCGEEFDEQISLQGHVEAIHQGTFPCHCCDARHTSGPLLLEHLQTHETKEKPFQCDLCLRRFSTQQYFNIHRKLGHKDNARMSCDAIECSEKFTTVQELNEHLKLHVREPSAQELQPSNVQTNSDGELEKSRNGPERIILNCSTCTRGYLSKYDLILHELVHTTHSEINTDIGYDCRKCSHRAHSLETLIVHHYTSHRENNVGVIKSKCSMCDKMFSSTIFFKAHLQAHQDERKASGELFPCDICGVQYADEVWLRVHRSIHAQEVPGAKPTGKCDETREFKRKRRSKKFFMRITPGSKPMPIFDNKCTVCEQDFELVSYLRDHLESMHETEEKSFHCWFCPRKFTLQQTVEVHRFSRHPTNKFCCEDAHCGKEFQTPEGLEQHLREHLTVGSTDQNEVTEDRNIPLEGKFKENTPMSKSELPNGYEMRTTRIVHCQKCNWGFMNPDLLELHEVVHATVNKSFKCPKCLLSFSTLTGLRFHFDKLHTQFIRPIECPECGVKLRARPSFLIHMRLRHKKRRREKNKGPDIQCKQCDYRTNDISVLQKHVRNRHPTEMIPCSAEGCSKKFRNSRNLAYHVRRYHKLDDRQLPCPMCGLKFLEWADVRAHITVAHGERTFVCDICGKAFKKEFHLKSHKEALHGDNKKDYICSDCGMIYKSNIGLHFHIGSVHTPESEKKYGCPYCPKRHHRRHLLNLHIKTCMKINGVTAASESGQPVTTANPTASQETNLNKP